DVRELDALDGIGVTAINVKRMERDQRDPARYRRRLDAFEKRIRDGGATSFSVVSSVEGLSERF
ncbi:MAG: hypothetical protein AAFY60_16765, partial [Myxococcota bacterium]